MNRAAFLKRSAGVAIAIAGLEQWHHVFDDASLAGAGPDEAVALADTVAPPVARGATLSTLSNILRTYYLPVIQEQLNDPFVLCCRQCQRPWRIGMLGRDGEIIRWVKEADAWEFIVYASCNCHHLGRIVPPRPHQFDETFHYLRVHINGAVLSKAGQPSSFLSVLGAELHHAVPEFKAHLEKHSIGVRKDKLDELMKARKFLDAA